MGCYAFSAARSAVSKFVEMDELGKVFALTYSVGSCFFVSAILTTIAFALSIIGWCRLSGKDISDLDKKPSAQPSYRQTSDEPAKEANNAETSVNGAST